MTNYYKGFFVGAGMMLFMDLVDGIVEPWWGALLVILVIGAPLLALAEYKFDSDKDTYRR